MVSTGLDSRQPGRSCRTCRKWDGTKCCDMRHKHNDDPLKPCSLYRYKLQAAVEPVDARPGQKWCPKCKRFRPEAEFVSKSNKIETRTCQRCLEKQRGRYASRKEGKK